MFVHGVGLVYSLIELDYVKKQTDKEKPAMGVKLVIIAFQKRALTSDLSMLKKQKLYMRRNLVNFWGLSYSLLILTYFFMNIINIHFKKNIEYYFKYIPQRSTLLKQNSIRLVQIRPATCREGDCASN